MYRFILLASPIVYLFTTEVHAAPTCEVDPTGSFAMPYTTVGDALAGGCDAPGTTIVVYCPKEGCSHPAVVLEELVEITLVSGEFSGAPGEFGGVTIDGGPFAAALRVVDSEGLKVIGFREMRSDENAVEIIDSNLRIAGPQDLGEAAYTMVTSTASTGVRVLGDSLVWLDWIGIHRSAFGLDLQSGVNGAPDVHASGLALLDNGTAATMTGGTTTCPASGGPELEIRGDFGPTWLNYVMGNDEGFLMHGASALTIDHTVLGGNLRNRPATRSNGMLFELRDAARIDARNLVAYDNDRIVNPGVALPWSTTMGPNTASIVMWYDSCAKSSVESSSFVDNESDLVFHMDTGPAPGKLTLDHVLAANNSGKTISASGFSPGCPDLEVKASMFWENRVLIDPPHCISTFEPETTTNVDPNVLTSPSTPDQLVSFPDIAPPPFDLYLLDEHELTGEPIPSDLYSIKQWGVDGVFDTDALDVGFHNRVAY